MKNYGIRRRRMIKMVGEANTSIIHCSFFIFNYLLNCLSN